MSYLASLLLEVAAAVGVVEHELQVGPGGGEGDLGVPLPAAAREAHLPLILRPVAVARVPHLGIPNIIFKLVMHRYVGRYPDYLFIGFI